MTPTLRDLGIDRLSVSQRIALAQEILDSVVAEEDRQSISEVKRQELDRRLADHAANPTDVIPWKQIEAEAYARFSR